MIETLSSQIGRPITQVRTVSEREDTARLGIAVQLFLDQPVERAALTSRQTIWGFEFQRQRRRTATHDDDWQVGRWEMGRLESNGIEAEVE
ncbi:hypothetical protein [Candidatus Amarolinea dominans]|uniref:hypothetical protein n=1 Tax=Candidatus Amarolinea dominans TaxID=3140696 RepID=UPI001D54DB57|nr:hypothetical protein [Anaerolineae bacterium]